MINLTQKTYNEINKELADRVAGLRKRKKLSQQELAKIAIALDVETELMELFCRVPFSSIEEVINGQG